MNIIFIYNRRKSNEKDINNSTVIDGCSDDVWRLCKKRQFKRYRQEANDVQTQLDNYGKDASDNISMDKIEGVNLEAAENEGEVKSEGNIGNYKVEVSEAKVIDYEDDKILLVLFDFENKSKQDINFAGALKVEATQDGGKLAPAMVNGVEGVDVSALAQNVSKGEKIQVQKVYKLMDEETPVKISVRAFDAEKNPGTIEKTFNLK